VKQRNASAMVVASAALAILGSGIAFEAAAPERETSYRVQPLASLGGTNSRGNGINDWELVAGFSNLAGNQARRATVWFQGRMFRLDPFGGTNSSIAWSGQNNSGLVVGIAQTGQLQTRADGWSCRSFFPGPDNAKYVCVGFVWEGGRMTPLPTLGGDNAFAASANDRRQIVGWSETTEPDPSCTDPTQRGFLAVLWDLNANRTVPLPPMAGDSATAATAISNRGQVAGISGDCDQSVGRRSARHAVLWETGAVIDLGNVGADTWNTPTAITPRGDIIVGFANTPGADPDDPIFHAWLWTRRDDIACDKLPGSNLCDLGTLDANGTAEAWGVNDSGQVVGTACSPAGDCRAFLWENGRMKDLNEVKGRYPNQLFNAMDINNEGQITGRAQTSTGFEGFVATPKRRN
jgi:probable HAF family extracellular repeat protein